MPLYRGLVAHRSCNFGSYGGGIFNPHYSVGGAYCFGPSGGHHTAGSGIRCLAAAAAL